MDLPLRQVAVAVAVIAVVAVLASQAGPLSIAWGSPNYWFNSNDCGSWTYDGQQHRITFEATCGEAYPYDSWQKFGKSTNSRAAAGVSEQVCERLYGDHSNGKCYATGQQLQGEIVVEEYSFGGDQFSAEQLKTRTASGNVVIAVALPDQVAANDDSYDDRTVVLRGYIDFDVDDDDVALKHDDCPEQAGAPDNAGCPVQDQEPAPSPSPPEQDPTEEPVDDGDDDTGGDTQWQQLNQLDRAVLGTLYKVPVLGDALAGTDWFPTPS